MIPYTVTAVVSYGIIILAVALMTLATKRFLSGEFKEILKWLLIGLWFMAIPYTLFIYREIVEPSENLNISWMIYACMVIVGLCILKSARLLDNFSKVYGFAHTPSKKEKNLKENE